MKKGKDMQRHRYNRQRGVTMISVMLMTVSLMTLGLLAVRSSTRDATAAGQLVARERALMVAQAAVDLAAAQYMGMNDAQLDESLVGYNPQAGACTDPCGDCIPDPATFPTGQRNELLDLGNPIGCGGRPCMRQGAVARLPDNTGLTNLDWCDIPFRDLVPGGDAEANVSVWVRNNSADAIGVNATPGNWLDDGDGQIVLTASARLRNTVVTVEKELSLSAGDPGAVMQPLSPDEGYGGGHNNDNSAVSMCTDDFVSAVAAGP
jgi:hypothetical protein